MFKRITWMSIGMAVGAAGAFRAKRKLEETIDRYLPEQVADRATASARGVSQVVRQAASEGRDVMRATESELRARVEARTFVGERPHEDEVPGRPVTPPGPRRQSRPGRTPPVGTPGSSARRRHRR